MVTSATQSQSQPPSVEEETLKRNTDCVYFLASPLTCKKGRECEYRHSDIARVNPRDCWFWLHGNCLNPKCGFRHPPLDGLQGAQTPTSTGHSAPNAQNVTAPSHVPNASAKQGAVACIYFQKGGCLRGVSCPFLHTPNSSSNKASSLQGAAFTTEPAAMNKKTFAELNNSMREKTALHMYKEKAIKDPPQSKLTNVVEPALFGNEFALNGMAPQAPGSTRFSRYRNASPSFNGNPINWSNRAQQPRVLDEPESLNNKDVEEVSREPSPGFDVLVDDDRRDSDYYTSEERYRMPMEQEGGNEYNKDHSTDYGTIVSVDDERYKGSLGYDSLERNNGGGHYAWEQHERLSGRYVERRPYDNKLDSSGQVYGSDLRYRLAKNRKPNCLRSVISYERHEDINAGDHGYHSSRRNGHRISLQENSLSSRLRGRLRLPGRLSPPDDTMSRGVSRGRVNTSPHQGRHRGKGELEEAFNNGGGDYRGHWRRETTSENTNFAGPKSLAELKNRKNSDPDQQNSTDQHPINKRKHGMLDFHPQSGSDLSFDGPKPLEEILKKKRGETIGCINSRNTTENQGVNEDEKQQKKDLTMNEVQQTTSIQKIDAEDTPLACIKPGPENGVVQYSDAQIEGVREFDYDDQVDGEELDMYDGENGDGNGEYVEGEEEEEEDDDEFAKKMGVVYSS